MNKLTLFNSVFFFMGSPGFENIFDVWSILSDPLLNVKPHLGIKLEQLFL